jgi:hypothetical protein
MGFSGHLSRPIWQLHEPFRDCPSRILAYPEGDTQVKDPLNDELSKAKGFMRKANDNCINARKHVLLASALCQKNPERKAKLKEILETIDASMLRAGAAEKEIICFIDDCRHNII